MSDDASLELSGPSRHDYYMHRPVFSYRPFAVLLLLLAISAGIGLTAEGSEEQPELPGDIIFPDSLLRFPAFGPYIRTFAPDDDCLCYLSSGYADCGGYRIFIQRFTATAGHIRGTVWIAHGYLHHSGYYLPFAARLRELGWNVVLFDLPGHGLSGGGRGDIGDFREYGRVLSDLAGLQGIGNLPRPWIGIGHSTGASAMFEQALEGEALFDRYLLLAPLIHSAHWSVSTYGLDHGGDRLETIPRAFPKTSSDPAFMRFLRREDFLTGEDLPVSWVEALVDWNRRLDEMPADRWARALDGRRILLIQGDRDRVVDWEYNLPYLTERLPQLEVRLLDGLYHDLLFEGDSSRARVYGAMADMLF
jgi:alpha-beta hydrolase superfamily lysophospholipase